MVRVMQPLRCRLCQGVITTEEYRAQPGKCPRCDADKPLMRVPQDRLIGAILNQMARHRSPEQAIAQVAVERDMSLEQMVAYLNLGSAVGFEQMITLSARQAGLTVRRAIFLKAVEEGMSVSGIAMALGLKSNAVSVLLHRARRKKYPAK